MEFKSFMEVLKGKQHKIDKNKNGKIDAHDFKLLQKEEQEITEATVKTQKYSWGTMKTVHHGSDFSIPLHPEHHEAIAKLKDQQEHKFKTEDGKHWTAKRSGDDVHFQGANGGSSTKVKHSTMSEEVEELDELSKKTLGSYAKAAALDALIKRKTASYYGDQGEKAKSPGIKAASDKISQSYKEKSSKRTDGVYKAVDRLTKEEVEQIDEVNHRELASVGKMHPQMAKYMTKGHEMDFYAQGSGDKISGIVKHNNGKEVHVQANKNGNLGGGLVHKFKVSSVHEDTAPWETEAEAKARKASSNFKKPSNPNRTGMDTARALAQKAMKQKMKEEFGLDITDEQADSLLEMSHAPVAPVPDRKYIKGTPEHKAYKALRKPINGMPTNVKEEAEQIDELSKGTLGSYIKKAKGSAIGSSQVMGMGSSTTGQKSQDKAEKNVQKRATGINKAVDRLTKEDIDFNDEGTLMTKTVSYKEFLEINEIKLADLPSRIVRGTSYGANYSDPEGSDDYDDKKPVKAAPEKRGRGRPSGAQSGARKNLGNSKLHTK